MKSVKKCFLEYATLYSDSMYEIYENRNSSVDRKKHLRIANQMILKIKKLYKQAFLLNDLSEIEEFLFHEDKYVRALAATYSLVYNPILAEKVLIDLINLPVPNYVAPTARLSLDSWKNGFLNPLDM